MASRTMLVLALSLRFGAGIGTRRRRACSRGRERHIGRGDAGRDTSKPPAPVLIEKVKRRRSPTRTAPTASSTFGPAPTRSPSRCRASTTITREGSNCRPTSRPRSTSSWRSARCRNRSRCRGVAGRRRAEQRQAAGADARSARRGADRQDHSGPRPARGRRHAELARRRRLARDAADLLRRARHGRRADGA